MSTASVARAPEGSLQPDGGFDSTRTEGCVAARSRKPPALRSSATRDWDRSAGKADHDCRNEIRASRALSRSGRRRLKTAVTSKVTRNSMAAVGGIRDGNSQGITSALLASSAASTIRPLNLRTSDWTTGVGWTTRSVSQFPRATEVAPFSNDNDMEEFFNRPTSTNTCL